MDIRRHSLGASWQALVSAAFVAGAGLVVPAALVADEVQIGRYASVQALPTPAQADLLAVIVSVTFPAEITTVGLAAQHLLERSGYRLAEGGAADPAQRNLLGLPLPAAHRALGPLRLRTALETLAGPAFVLVEDPVHRLVTFELCGDDDAREGSVAEASTHVD